MIVSQNQIRNLYIATAAMAASRGRPNDVAFIDSRDAHFKFVIDSSLTIDDEKVIQGAGTDGRWVRTGAAIETFLPDFALVSDLASVAAHAAPDTTANPHGLVLYCKENLKFFGYDEATTAWAEVGEYSFNSEMLEVVVGANVSAATPSTFASVIASASGVYTASADAAKVFVKDLGTPLFLNGVLQERAAKILATPYSSELSINIAQGLYVGDTLHIESYYPLIANQLASAYKEMHV